MEPEVFSRDLKKHTLCMMAFDKKFQLCIPKNVFIKNHGLNQ